MARLPLGEEAGDLEVGLRGEEVTLTTSEQRVLALVTPLLAQTLRLRTLATELQDSREQTVAAVEDERLRLRRDLHDGLGPTLSGIAFTSDAARNLLRTEPARAEELLDELRRQTGAALDDVRRIVYAMRPPALDELGLLPAVRQATTGLQNTEGTPLRVTCTRPGPARAAGRGRGGGVPDRGRGGAQHAPGTRRPEPSRCDWRSSTGPSMST